MNKIYKIAIISSFLGLWTVSFLDKNIQTFLGFFLVFTFGIIHGTNDITLFAKTNGKKSIGSTKLLSYYIAIVLLGIAFFWLLPTSALFCFIVVSGYHFGQQHFEYVQFHENNILKILLSFCYGSFILLLLFLFNKTEVTAIIFEICGLTIQNQFYLIMFYINSFFLVICYLLVAKTDQNVKNNLVLELFYLLFFAVLFFSTSLIWGFALYFILWHSVPSIASQIVFVYGETNSETIKKYIKTGALYWVFSIIGITILYILLHEEKIFNSIFFSFLAAITFPHVFIIENMFASKKS